MNRIWWPVLLLAVSAAPLQAQERAYAEGQVWAYKVRPGDEGSLLKIQKIETDEQGEPVFHISVIGSHLHSRTVLSILPHEPVSRRTLDASVVEQRPDKGGFPSADEGIAQWKRARGGVFIISVAETIDVLDKTLQAQPH